MPSATNNEQTIYSLRCRHRLAATEKFKSADREGPSVGCFASRPTGLLSPLLILISSSLSIVYRSLSLSAFTTITYHFLSCSPLNGDTLTCTHPHTPTHTLSGRLLSRAFSPSLGLSLKGIFVLEEKGER